MPTSATPATSTFAPVSPAPAAPSSPTPAASKPTTAAWTVSPTSFSFGHVTVGESAAQSFTVTNAGNGEATIESASLNGAGYQLAATPFPIPVKSGASVTLQVIFAPSSAGTSNGTLMLSTSNSSALSVTLTGLGVVPVQHTVTLNWMASPSIVDGYNVYRGTQSGGPYSRITASPTPSTNYQDASVMSGTTYYYVVTAVASGIESLPTNEIPAAVPSP